jgi:hypothetical protein
MNKLLIGFGAVVTLLTGCATNSVNILGESYELNEQGQIELTAEQLKHMQQNGVPYIKESAPGGGREIDPQALALLKKDSQAFDAVLFPEEAQEKAIEIHAGSFKASVEQFATKYGMKLTYEAVDVYVSRPEIITGERLIDVLYEAAKPYPIKVAVIDKEIVVVNKIATISQVKANADA